MKKILLNIPIFILLIIDLIFCLSVPAFCGDRFRPVGIVVFIILLPYMCYRMFDLFQTTILDLKKEKGDSKILTALKENNLYGKRLSMLISIGITIVMFSINMIAYIFEPLNLFLYFLSTYYVLLIMLKEYLLKAYNRYVIDYDEIRLYKVLKIISIIGLLMPLIFFVVIGMITTIGKDGSLNLYLIIITTAYTVYSFVKTLGIFRSRKKNFNIIKYSSAFIDLLALLISIMSGADSLLRYNGISINDNAYLSTQILILFIGTILVLIESFKTIKYCARSINKIKMMSDNA